MRLQGAQRAVEALAGKESGGESLLRIGPCLKKLLAQLPKQGDLFPKMSREDSKNRSSEFGRRCKMLGIEGRSLHSYRYAWAQRARAAGMPEREAMNHLGHESRAIHAAYAGGAQVAVLPLEFYEAQKLKNVVQFSGGSKNQIPDGQLAKALAG
jgi:integrase